MVKPKVEGERRHFRRLTIPVIRALRSLPKDISFAARLLKEEPTSPLHGLEQFTQVVRKLTQ